MLRTFALATSLALLTSLPAFAQNERTKQVRKDKEELQDDDFWIYNDLDEGIAESRKTGRPLLIVFR